MQMTTARLVLLLLLVIPGTSLAQRIMPANAEPNPIGSGWVCKRGYRESSGQCIAVVVPNNAEIDIYGHAWTCKRGFRENGGKCIAVTIPTNAELDVFGHGWVCNRGFRDIGGACIAVVIPLNAELDVFGHGWACVRGYQDVRGRCVAVVFPDNAELDAVGHGWTCRFGFKRVAERCVPMSPAEKQKLADTVARIRERQRRLESASCEIGHKPATGTHAEVVLQHPGCDYFIADGSSGLFLIEWYGGHVPSEGDIVIGPIDSYGFQDVCYPGYGEGHVWVDDYLLSKSSALEHYHDKCK
ncbi:MAG TPA: hypothetical protein VF493_03920 [Terriglobales bacterium]